MSGICGIIHFDGAPVSRAEVLRMANAAPHRGPHGTFIHCEGSVGLVYQSLEITPESVGERQPVAGPAGSLLLADARLDNRGDFAAHASGAGGARGGDERPATDAELMLAELLRDPEGGPARILGDFAWALWDPRSCELRLARDAMGMRALYYRVEPNRVLFATEVKQILAADRVPRKLNELAVAWHLTGMQTPPGVVFYEGIDAVLPGEEVRVGPGARVHRRIFWRPDPRHRIRYRRDEEYAEHLRELLIDAMRARLRTKGPVGVSLSGGLDSGTIASVAGWLRERNAPGAPAGGWPEIRAYTWAFTELPQCDERENAYRIANHYGIPVQEIPAEETYPLVNYPAHGPDEDDPFMSMFQPFVDTVADSSAADGASVLFHGTRGDLMFGGTVVDIYGLLLSGRLGQVRTELGLLRRYENLSRAAVLLRYVVAPGFSRIIPPALRRCRGRPIDSAEAHVSRSFLVRSGLPDRDPVDIDSESRWDESGRERYRHVYTSLVMGAVVFLDRLCALRGVGFSDPWSDRRIADFALACPQHALHCVTDQKRLPRRALDGMLPDPRAARKIVPAPLYYHVLRSCVRPTVQELITNARAAELGFVDRVILSEQWDSFLSSSNDAVTFDLWSTLSLEIWLRNHWAQR